MDEWDDSDNDDSWLAEAAEDADKSINADKSGNASTGNYLLSRLSVMCILHSKQLFKRSNIAQSCLVAFLNT